jgi:hypothetical protein
MLNNYHNVRNILSDFIDSYRFLYVSKNTKCEPEDDQTVKTRRSIIKGNVVVFRRILPWFCYI